MINNYIIYHTKKCLFPKLCKIINKNRNNAKNNFANDTKEVHEINVFLTTNVLGYYTENNITLMIQFSIPDFKICNLLTLVHIPTRYNA